MAEGKARRIWARFCLRHLNTWIQVKEADPGLRVDLEETAQEIQNFRYTTEGAVVRDLPRMQKEATQTGTEDSRSRAVQAEPRRESRGTQTEDEATSVDERESRNRTSRRRDPAPIREGCWNCSEVHPYTRCPRPRRQFCYGCGEPGVTLWDCRRCGPEYRRTGPYREVRGPRDRSLSREWRPRTEQEEDEGCPWEAPEVE